MTKLVFNAETLAKSINSENGNEIVFEEYFDIQKSEGENPKDPKFEYFKKKILDHLAELEKKENHSIAKAIDIDEWIQKANFPVGTVRTWNGQKFKKITPKKWARVYETESRGAKLAVAALRRKAAACRNSEELLQLCLENMERFRDNNGHPLPFMQEFSEYVSWLNDAHEKGAAKGKKIDEIWNKQQARIKELRKKGYSDEQIDNDDVIKQTKKDMQDLDKEPAKEEPKENNKITVGYEKYFSHGDSNKKLNNAQVEAINNKIKELGKEKHAPTFDTDDDYFEAWGRLDRWRETSNGITHAEQDSIMDAMLKAKSEEKPKPYYSKEDWEKLKKLDKETAEKNAALGLASSGGSDGNGSTYLEYLEGVLKRAKLNAENGIESVREENKKDIPVIEAAIKEEKKKTNPPKTDNEPNKKGIESIREKYQSSLSVEGDEDEIYVGKEAIQGKWKLVEADAPSASHDEITFHKTEGFPTAKDGSTVNDRDYEHDTEAQETVIDIASDFDGRALGFDSPIVVTQDGVVTSGNNRTMSSKIAARKGTDTKYIEALKKRSKKFGFSADDIAKFKHPRVVFEIEHTGDYTTSEFAKYNESGKKAMNPVEKAVKVSKMIQPQTIEDVASIISEFDTMSDLYADKKASQSIFNTLIQSNIIQKTDLPQYYSDNTVTASGKEFLETVLIGSVINETNIRSLNTKGGRSIRQKLVRAITPLIENKGMKGYSINKELNEAVGIAVEVAHHKDQFPNVEAFSKHQDMFRKLDPVSIELAKKLEGTQKGFAEFMFDMNVGLRPAANGEVDIFLGECESKEDIVNRVLNIKKTVEKALNRFFRIFGTTI